MTPRERHEAIPAALRGAAAIWEMLNMIGEPEKNDHDMARVFCENEMEVRALVAFAQTMLSKDGLP